LRHPSRLISGVISAALIFTLAGCIYSLRSGGISRDLRTFAVLPFDNRTTTSGIERELATLIATEMRKMGRREAPEASAHIIVSGVISRYDVDIPVAYSADPNRAAGTRRRLELSIDVNVKNTLSNASIFQKTGMVEFGEYAESAEQTGRQEALGKVVNSIVRGIQSQW
jgi:hypothetical protein